MVVSPSGWGPGELFIWMWEILEPVGDGEYERERERLVMERVGKRWKDGMGHGERAHTWGLETTHTLGAVRRGKQSVHLQECRKGRWSENRKTKRRTIRGHRMPIRCIVFTPWCGRGGIGGFGERLGKPGI